MPFISIDTTKELSTSDRPSPETGKKGIKKSYKIYCL